jgi:hypothetical protein
MILIENNFDGVEALVESVEGGKKKTYLTGTFMESERKNRNGRIYETSDLEKAVHKINDASKVNRHILGHMDHPSHLEIKLDEVAIKLVEARMDGKNVWAKAEVLEAVPKGQILKGLLESGVQVGVSSRGTGQVNESTGRVSNFNFVTIDVVSQPSAIGAFPQTIQEQLEMYKRGEVVNDLAEAVIHDKHAQWYFQQEMKKFIDHIRSK